MLVDTKLESAIDRIDNSEILRTGVLQRFKPVLLLLVVAELLPVLINIARGLPAPFFSPADINQHAYHHIHFLVYGFPVGFAIWLIMDWRIRTLERQLSRLRDIYQGQPLAWRTRWLGRLPQALLIFSFWFGWDDFKFHYLSRYWSLVHEFLVLWH
ncbi:MAG: hypothetical protein AB1489_02215 [Acidobacteriota bacterium]